MAIFNISVQPAKNRSPIERYDYVLRIGKYSPENNKDKYDDIIYGENVNMPSFSQENPRYFWECDEVYEDVNANLFRTIDFSLPYELSDEENIELAKKFAKELFGESYVYSLAIHSKPSTDEDKRNIHCHIMFYERELDGIERKEECFFKKANSKNPSLGGAKKNVEWKQYKKLYYIRQTLETMMNEKLKEMINSLFSLAKASSGNIELHPEKFELNRLVEQIFADMHDHVKESELQFVKQLTEENTEIISDNMYFYRICQNLIENALKYSAKHTRVFVKTYQKESSNHLCLEITNTAGYPMDFTKEEIIERFFRGDKQRSSEGNGLGLAIVSTYVKALGGEFDIKIDCDQFKACVEMPLSAITIT